MGLAKLMESNEYGLPRKDFEEALLKLSDIARITEQKIILRIDSSIQQKYNHQIDKIGKVTESLRTIERVV